MTVTQRTKREVYERDEGKCRLCSRTYPLERVPHHCFFKSQYKKFDVDFAWNLITICLDCHCECHLKSKKVPMDLQKAKKAEAREIAQAHRRELGLKRVQLN